MTNLLLHDTRVQVIAPPPNDFYLPIESHQGLERFISDLVEFIDVLGRGEDSGHTLHILAHGGPAGILLGMPGLSQFNVGIFVPLWRKVSTIIFHSCAATRVYSGAHVYDGAHMCRYLSQIVECRVVGADQTQYLSIDSFFRNGSNALYAPWQGTVSVYQNGQLINSNTPFMRQAGFAP